MTPERTPEEIVSELLDRIVEGLDLEAEVHVEDDGETVTGRLIGHDLGLFIGHHGQTIDAVQHLAHRLVEHQVGRDDAERRRVVVDAAGYRERRRGTLERQADEAADEALRSGDGVPLDPMVASERRIVHEHLRERGDVRTESTGQEPNRRLVVFPAAD